jgi:hypothetical protein
MFFQIILGAFVCGEILYKHYLSLTEAGGMFPFGHFRVFISQAVFHAIAEN